jgi:Abnormal spindle-like microcephaly-assoc'd, ASPM-SPD-2-Hydin
MAICLAGRAQASTSVAFDPPVLDFGDVVVGTTSTQTVIVTNVGPETLEGWYWSVDFQGKVDYYGFLLQHDCFSLAPGSSCVLTFSFTPASVGNKRGTFSMYDHVVVNGQDQFPLVGTVGLRARGLKPPR